MAQQTTILAHCIAVRGGRQRSHLSMLGTIPHLHHAAER